MYSRILLVGMMTLLFAFQSPFSVTAKEDVEGESETQADTYERLKIFSEILSLVESSYVEEVKANNLIEGAIRGMVKTLDPHSSYLNAESFKAMQVETSGKFGGLGIEISMRNGILTVVSPIEDTPAWKAGVKAGDKIIKIEEESTLDMTLTDAVSRLRGERGKPINITIFRETRETPFEVTIVRDIIKVRSVKHKIYEDTVGYVSIRSFTKSTASDMDAAIAEMEMKGITKLILDVRNNPGGLLNQAVEVTDRFLDSENLIVYTKGRNEEQNMRFTTRDDIKRVKYPMVILVNSGSASASEIVSGALQDLGRAIILGNPTFGKGSVQTIIPLSDGSALRLTTARYYTPSGRVIQENGIVPDIIVDQDPVSEVEEDAKEEESEEKSTIRRILREKDLKKHLKGKSSIDGETPEGLDTVANDESDSEEASESQEKLKADLQKDAQLRHAVFLLRGWDIMKNNIRRTSETQSDESAADQVSFNNR
ncbi:MAG: S41 family peptidase [Candidatus Nitrohelix vancouverensis]|uniref:S41 family peptidase n=1 Tax=Candidatus Nitrohelix vancouverensis TaxID=2705534 RepID=A0A7T0G4Z5_9BACT|nr:MAG: S41 family peptidase [Candidatus Nitrohelix vancouverensis]